jgi:hypothetical protein
MKARSILVYCDANELLTGACRMNIAELFEDIGAGMPIHDVATIIWSLSATKKKPAEIEAELVEVYRNAEDESSS